MNKNIKIGVVGMGYVGLPLACLFAKKYPVIGYDTNLKRVELINAGYDFTHDTPKNVLSSAIKTGLICKDNINELSDCNVFIVCVPTDVDNNHQPNLQPLISASQSIGTILKRGDIVIYESSVYPGCTEEVCVPQLQTASGLLFNKDFTIGYSPERINPGDEVHTVDKIKKIVSASTTEAADFVEELYGSVILGGTCRATSIRVAEAAKIVENTQRDINIAFMNELTMIFDKMNINMKDVIDCASTKWNFTKVKPGLVGGHCVGIDPYYFIHCALKHGVEPRLMTDARNVNESMASYTAEQLIKKMKDNSIDIASSRILILGFTFKANCNDIRNTKVADVYKTLKQFTPNVDIYDPMADETDVLKEYGIRIINNEIMNCSATYDGIIVCVKHNCFIDLDIKHLLKPNGVIHELG